ncbi:MAG: acyltransferase [Myxococcales bacterium]|nr:acyltransferase [Myxococcota bacterium]MDW8281112.1 acyltransferase [Myxococcales bacterium]
MRSDPTAPCFRLGHQPALDGLRGLAAGVVLLGHARLPFLPGGYLGVDLFFVLSGFLITTLLLQEQAQTGRICLLRFYGRRALRLLPALCAVVGVSLLYGGLGPAAVAREMALDAAGSLLYVENWLRALTAHQGPLLGHTWSLAIEEQFYLTWPLLVGSRRGIAPLVAFALLGALASALLRAALFAGPATVPRLYHGTDTRADALLTGCALGLAWATPAVRAHLRAAHRLIAAAAWVATGVLGAVLLGVRADDAWLYRGGLSLLALCAAALLLCALVAPPRLLLWPPLRWLGRISYGLYLWHYPTFQVFWLHGWLTPAGRLAAATLSVAAAALSYYGLERPFLALKAALSPSQDSSRVARSRTRAA